MGAAQSIEPASGSRTYGVAPALTWRVVDRAAIALGFEYSKVVNGWQYVAQSRDVATQSFGHYVLAQLDQTIASLTTRVDYAFGPRATLQFYAQPFISGAKYSGYKTVADPRAVRVADRLYPIAGDQLRIGDDGGVLSVDLNRDGTPDFSFSRPDFNRTDLNANLVFRWEYDPGSTVFLVWSHQRSAQASDGKFALERDLHRMLDVAATNVLLLKVSRRFVQ
jgi:hypothetical protein